MKTAAVWIAFVISLAWFLLLTLVALVMGSGFADEPGDTNGFRRFAVFFALGLPGLFGALVCGHMLRKSDHDRKSALGGFVVLPPSKPKSSDPN